VTGPNNLSALLFRGARGRVFGMRARVVGRICLMVGLALWGLSKAGANPLKDPKRSVNERTVDLSPLFNWWTNHNGTRPLVAWVQVTGSVVGTNSGSWIIEAKLERTARNIEASRVKDSAPGEQIRVMLKHPPLQDRATFEKLSQQLKALNAQRTTLAAGEAAAKTRRQAIADEETLNRAYGIRTRGLAAESRQMQQAWAQVSAQIKVLDQQIQGIKRLLSAYPETDQYVVDCFALDLGQEMDRIPVFDYGSVLK
jgi:hypothetical protein